jgi:hypothetical protein
MWDGRSRDGRNSLISCFLEPERARGAPLGEADSWGGSTTSNVPTSDSEECDATSSYGGAINASQKLRPELMLRGLVPETERRHDGLADAVILFRIRPWTLIVAQIYIS